MKKIFYISTVFISIFGFIAVAQTSDTTPPIISNARAENITNYSAQIKWLTDDPSDSIVFYGPTTNVTSTISYDRCDTGGLVIEHCVNLTNLTFNTVYYYRVKSMNSINLASYSNEYSFHSGSSGSGGGTNYSSTPTPSYTPIYTATPTPYYSPTPTPIYNYPSPTPSPTPTPTPTPIFSQPSTVMVDGIIYDSGGGIVAKAGIHIFKSDFSFNFETLTDVRGIFYVNLSPDKYVIEIFPPLTELTF